MSLRLRLIDAAAPEICRSKDHYEEAFVTDTACLRCHQTADVVVDAVLGVLADREVEWRHKAADLVRSGWEAPGGTSMLSVHSLIAVLVEPPQ